MTALSPVYITLDGVMPVAGLSPHMQLQAMAVTGG